MLVKDVQLFSYLFPPAGVLVRGLLAAATFGVRKSVWVRATVLYPAHPVGVVIHSPGRVFPTGVVAFQVNRVVKHLPGLPFGKARCIYNRCYVSGI
jgi:hypothetical protein